MSVNERVKYVFLPDNQDNIGINDINIHADDHPHNTDSIMQECETLLAQELEETQGFIQMTGTNGEKYFYNNNLHCLFGDLSGNPLKEFCTFKTYNAQIGEIHTIGLYLDKQNTILGNVAAQDEYNEIFKGNGYINQNTATRYRWNRNTLSNYIAIATNTPTILNQGDVVTEINHQYDDLFRLRFGNKQYATIRDTMQIFCFPVLRLSKVQANLSLSELIKWFYQTYSIYPYVSQPICAREVNGLLQFQKTVVKTADDKQIQTIKDICKKCDSEKFGAKIYEDDIFSAPKGHWGLWQSVKYQNASDLPCRQNGVYIDISGANIYALDPNECVQENIVGIDFGTTGTVAGIYDGKEIVYITLSTTQDNENKFENPTILKYIDRVSFEDSYRKSEFSPDTKLADINIGHMASNDLKQFDRNKNYLQYVTNLKQWIKDSQIRLNIYDSKGNLKDAGSYCDINDLIEKGEFVDPIEIYAYYIGLFINNMSSKHIYINYRLSFSSTYPKGLLEQMRKSFENGIRKSIPKEVLQNPNYKISVKLYRDEATAYAIAAFDRYLEQARHNEDQTEFNEYINELQTQNGGLLLGVFDKGGGTLDYSFSSITKGNNGSLSLKNLNTGGISWHGCENILEMLAFKIFTQNSEYLIEHKYFCVKPPRAPTPSNNNGFIQNDLNEAHFNTIKLVNGLREIWINGFSDQSSKSISSILSNLHPKEDNPPESQPESQSESQPESQSTAPPVDDNPMDSTFKGITKDEIENYFKKEIQIGVESFLELLEEIKAQYPGLQNKKCHVFLAGNACRGNRVIDVFNEYKNDNYPTQVVIRKTLPVDYDMENDNNGIPLTQYGKPTAKTGVVYGMVKDSYFSNIEQGDIGDLMFSYHVGHKTADYLYGEWYNTIVPAIEMPKSTQPYKRLYLINKLNNEKENVVLCEIGYTCNNLYQSTTRKYKNYYELTFINISVKLPEGYEGGLYLCCRQYGESFGTLELAVSGKENPTDEEAIVIGTCNLNKNKFMPCEYDLNKLPKLPAQPPVVNPYPPIAKVNQPGNPPEIVKENKDDINILNELMELTKQMQKKG